VFSVGFKHNLHINSKDIPVTGRGGPQVCFLWGSNIIYI
jgi:hypothetical protein